MEIKVSHLIPRKQKVLEIFVAGHFRFYLVFEGNSGKGKRLITYKIISYTYQLLKNKCIFNRQKFRFLECLK